MVPGGVQRVRDKPDDGVAARGDGPRVEVEQPSIGLGAGQAHLNEDNEERQEASILRLGLMITIEIISL